VLIVKAGARSPLRLEQRPEYLWLVLAFAIWFLHNIGDNDIYFGSVGVLGAVILGMLWAQRSGRTAQPAGGGARLPIALVSTLAVAAMVFSALACFSNELQFRAQIEYDNKKLPTAVETLQTAIRISPMNSSLYHDMGEILLNLYQTKKEPQYLTQSMEAFQSEVKLSPKKAGGHTGYALTLSSAGRMAEAIEQIRLAQSLYPSSSYIYSITQLMEKNAAFSSPQP
jgi:tetratricopeptide (TPR) repeat protein